ncbi:TetR family transcriptional regulator [Mycobacterium triplex]|uniref:TetR family transcriptional regulator n=1 Tax=Mycobacterium triplex TaxID=47839 RepID=A0A024K2Z2_9MYCO|nr:TetR/AcrR family transcriptional regulator [Mycobacterium triplex]ORW99999.1 TetR family transcriptional regulator [Mycobacterium triplex]CDO90169.1 TetR family transcriptional regulator [Mycobacterium triplex]
MSSPVPRRRPGRPFGADGTETRLKILHSARQVFATTGYERASLKQIAQDAGITRNAITNYYASKIDLYAAALASVHDVVAGHILDDAKAATGSVHRRLMAVFESAVASSQTDKTFVRFFVISTADAITHPELRDKALLPIDSVRQYVGALLSAAAHAGEIDADIDPEATTQVCINLLWGLAMDIGFYSDERRAQRTMRAIDRIITATLAPTPH